MKIKLDTVKTESMTERILVLRLDEDEYAKMFDNIGDAFDPKFVKSVRKKVMKHLGKSDWVCPFVISIWQGQYLRYYNWVGTEFFGYPAHLYYERILQLMENGDDGKR